MAKKRTEEEIRRAFPDVADLADRLKPLREIDVRFDGTGASAFKVYLNSDLLPGDDVDRWFLEIHTPIEKGSFISWAGQCVFKELCRNSFRDVIIEPGNPNGSVVKKRVKVEWIVSLTTHYVSNITSKSTK